MVMTDEMVNESVTGHKRVSNSTLVLKNMIAKLTFYVKLSRLDVLLDSLNLKPVHSLLRNVNVLYRSKVHKLLGWTQILKLHSLHLAFRHLHTVLVKISKLITAFPQSLRSFKSSQNM